MTGQLPSSGLICLLLLTLSINVNAQPVDGKLQPERGETVEERTRPELQELGIFWGSFYLYPKLGLREEYNDNVFAVEHDTESDRISVLSPAVSLASNWNRHQFEVNFDSALGRYHDFSTEDYNDLQLSASARIDIFGQSFISMGASVADLHESRSSPDEAGGINPGEYQLKTAIVGLTYKPGKVSLSPVLFFDEYDFHDIKAEILGQEFIIDQDDRDRSSYSLGFDVNYEQGSHTVFFRIKGFDTEYDHLQNFTGYDRSSDGYETAIGVELDMGGISSAEVYYGTHQQRFNEPLPDIDTPIYALLLSWNTSLLTTLELGGQQNTGQTNSTFYSGYVSRLLFLRLAHEIQRDLIFSFDIGRIDDRYEGVGPASRDDQTDSAAVKLKRSFNRNINASLAYEYTNRKSSDNTIPENFEDGTYKNNVFWLGIELKL